MNNNFINFKSLAKEATTLSHLMEDRVKVTTDDIISGYPDGITITEFDYVNTGKEEYYIAGFSEDEGAYLNCGLILAKVFDSFVKAFDGDINGASDCLKEQGGLKVKLEKTRTRSGNTITRVSVI